MLWTAPNRQKLTIQAAHHRIAKASHPRAFLWSMMKPTARQWLADALVQYGYHVNTVGDGAAAWEALQDKTYDLVITDNSMPKLTGIEMVKLLRGKDTTLPVIMVSAALPEEELKRHPWLGINAFFLKPFTIGEMLNTVQKTLNGPEWTAADKAMELR